jgi:hypothetical protein
MRATTDPFQLSSLAEGLAGLAAKVDPKLGAQGAEKIVEAMRATTVPNQLRSLAGGLAGLAAKVDPKLTAPLAEKIVEAMRATTDPYQLSTLAGGLAGLAAKVDPKLSAQAAEKIVEVMRATTDPYQLISLAGGLAGLAAKVDPKLTALLAEKIVEAMRATTDPYQLSSLAQGLFDLKEVQSVGSPQIAVDLLKQPLAVMPLSLSYFIATGKEYPRTLMDCLLAYLGRGLRKEPFPDLQSFFVWAKAHPEADLDLESPPKLRVTNQLYRRAGSPTLGQANAHDPHSFAREGSRPALPASL